MSLDLAGPDVTDRRARLAVAALFFTNGALFANLILRYPQIKDDHGLGNAAYGLSVAAFPTGALIAGAAAGVLVRRFGSAAAATAGTLLTGLGVLVAGVSTCTGCGSSVATGVRSSTRSTRDLVDRRRDRRCDGGRRHRPRAVPRAAPGHLGGPVRRRRRGRLPLLPHRARDRTRNRLPGPDLERQFGREPATVVHGSIVGRRTILIVAALVLIAMAGTLVEDAGNTWAAVYLSGSLSAPAAVAAWGYIALVGAQFVGRTVGDRLVDRFGQRTVARGLVTAAGMGLALANPSVPGVISASPQPVWGSRPWSRRRCTRPTNSPG